ncbi:nucleoside hydrolase [Cohnella sp. JJ-181]|uniref:nucleoside hydrolase n=1 Tax=Cohnella rhizoplanae TaxID=2974897 RepID=UPI0022FF57FB|nr:nucleoside hydrolase [Cohnella sp. JJ-181]CAI6076590.1 Pyrimidine-specific ribonucleoside hydrolase RihA [Cohnella sp. JJ-181]
MPKTWTSMTQERRTALLAHPGKKVSIVLDTDTYNEIDDQFALIYALRSPESVEVEAVHAAPFHNELSDGPADGMEKSYREILKIRTLAGREDLPVYRGSTAYLPGPETPVESEAARDLIRRALARGEDDPLYVVAIGAITNVASALLLEPAIADRIVLVWLGGHAFHWKDTREFNLAQDAHAARVAFDSGVPLVLLPCMGVVSHLTTTLSEVRDHVKDKGALGSYLYETFRACMDDHVGRSRVIWDMTAIAWLIRPAWCPSELAPSPLVTDDCRWATAPGRHEIRYVSHVDRDAIFSDLFAKLGRASGREA